eukprot:CAMPEP_0171864988 /NCGR_PEP_ID=MMETSP0992-20121227/29206_1 /TAXON_ID=483369 /ORGANISM="non described non described, Strain CCMP2098" /LENGTH=48 /DNA_ID= /DNA_START= /DNA_END= /DNA_ORIENTATION=
MNTAADANKLATACALSGSTRVSAANASCQGPWERAPARAVSSASTIP